MSEYKSTLNVYDIIPSAEGKDAVIALAKNKAEVKETVNMILDTMKGIETELKKTPENSPMYIFWSEFKKRSDASWEEYVDEQESKLSGIRLWANESLREMKKRAPEMTGHLISSIRIMGTGPLDINVDIDQDLISKRETLTNKVPYYDGRKEGTVKITVGGYDYSIYANENARPKNWWDPSAEQISLYHFKAIWEFGIKQVLASKYDIIYEPEMEEEL